MIKNQLAAFKRKIKLQIADVIFDRMMGSVPEQGRHPFGAEELKLLRQALVSQNLCCIGGQMVSSFEKEFAYTYGVLYGVASTSGTAAIHVALGALDLNPGDESARQSLDALTNATAAVDDPARMSEFEGYIRQSRFKEVEPLLSAYVVEHPKSAWGW